MGFDRVPEKCLISNQTNELIRERIFISRVDTKVKKKELSGNSCYLKTLSTVQA